MSVGLGGGLAAVAEGDEAEGFDGKPMGLLVRCGEKVGREVVGGRKMEVVGVGTNRWLTCYRLVSMVFFKLRDTKAEE